MRDRSRPPARASHGTVRRISAGNRLCRRSLTFAVVSSLLSGFLLSGVHDTRRHRPISRAAKASGGSLDQVERFVEKNHRRFHPRRRWWPFPGERGLRYGTVPAEQLGSPFTLILPNNKGSIDTRRAGPRDDLPAALRWSPARPAAGTGRGDYFIIQLAARVARGLGSIAARRLLTSRGAFVIDYIPRDAYLVRIARGDGHRFDDPELFQFLSPYQPADKLDPSTGSRPLLDPVRAASDVFDLVIRIMPGEDPAAVEEAVRDLDGEIVQAQTVAGEHFLSVKLSNTRVIELLQLPGVRGVREAPEYTTLNLTSSAQVELGRFLDPRDFGDFLLPFRQAGIDGGGVFGGFLPDYADANPSSSLTLDPNGFDVMPQFLGVADNGLTLDSPAFANDNMHPCLTGDCVGGAGGITGVGPMHRKVEVYTKGNDVNNDGIVDDATSTGDFLTCDDIRSGGRTHGTIVAGGAAANPSGGPLGLGRLYSDEDAIDQFPSFFNDSRETQLPLDGQAPGARIIFEDIGVVDPGKTPRCAGNLASDVDAGDVPAARLEDMVYRRDLDPSNATIHPRGADVTLFAFGNPVNFDDVPGNGNGNYSAGADTIDAFLFRNRRVTHIQPVGNDGISRKGPFDDPNFSVALIQITSLATGKNIVSVGANYTDSIDPQTIGSSPDRLDPSESIAEFTSIGPATFNSLRIAPLVIAPGFDRSQGRAGSAGDDYFVSSAQVVSKD
ncbi:MAG: S8 family serine peptidase, partial [Acidobacteriota bacterium]